MLVLTRWYYGKSGSVLDADDMSDEHVMKEQLHEAKMQGLVFENLKNLEKSCSFFVGKNMKSTGLYMSMMLMQSKCLI